MTTNKGAFCLSNSLETALNSALPKTWWFLFLQFYQLCNNGFSPQVSQSRFLTQCLSHTTSHHSLTPSKVHLPSCPNQGSQPRLRREHTRRNLSGATIPVLCVGKVIPNAMLVAYPGSGN